MKNCNKTNKGYIITNIVNNKQYVGITSGSMLKRWKLHLMSAEYPKYASPFHKAINKYGFENFILEIVEVKQTWKEIQDWEIKTIKELNTKVPNGYNVTDGGEGAPGVKRTEEHKKIMSEIKTEYYKDPKKREEQSVRSKANWKKTSYRKKVLKHIKEMWNDPIMKENILEENKKIWEDGSLREKHKKGLLASIEKHKQDPIWIMKQKEKKQKLVSSPEWRALMQPHWEAEHPYKKERITKKTQEYWNEGHEDRRKQHAITMRETVLNNLKSEEYIKWRNENPPNGKPILYNFKYFRSIQEVANYFKLSRPTVDRHLLQNKEGCKRLDPALQYKFEIQY